MKMLIDGIRNNRPLLTETGNLRVVEVFKTNVDHPAAAQGLLCKLSELLPEHRINFDLEDCDRILRVEGTAVPIHYIVDILTGQGFTCQELDD